MTRRLTYYLVVFPLLFLVVLPSLLVVGTLNATCQPIWWLVRWCERE